jgi:hypothetical protein
MVFSCYLFVYQYFKYKYILYGQIAVINGHYI